MTVYTEAIDKTRRQVRERIEAADFEALHAAAVAAAPVRSLSEALAEDTISLIVEPKRATVLHGLTHPDLDIAAVAAQCETAGVQALSIVTEPFLAHGALSDVSLARASCELPIMARDFVVHPLQVYELRAAGADAICLSMLAFRDVDEDDEQREDLESVIGTASSLGMDVVLSVVNEDELALALDHDVDIINIDNRNARHAIDVERTFDMLAEVPAGKTVISESVDELHQVERLRRAGVDALLLDEGHLDGDLDAMLGRYTEVTRDEEL